jgi:hypothetical protein
MARFDRGYFTRILADNFGNGFSNYFPLYLRPGERHVSLFDAPADSAVAPNVSDRLYKYFASRRSSERDVFFHLLGLLHSPGYRAENSAALRQNWPRIPLPATRDALLASAELGRMAAELLDVEEPVDAVTAGSIHQELRQLGSIATTDGRSINPSAGDLAVTAGWGHAGRGGVTMPGRGRVIERPYSPAELAAFRASPTSVSPMTSS